MSTIEIRKLTKRFGDLVAVDAIDLEVEAGEVVCLLGPSGCGKTTTLRMVAGLEAVTDGEVKIAGERVNERAPRDRDVAMVFQFYALYPTLSVAENLAFPLHAERLGGADIESRVGRVLDLLQLGDVADRVPGHLAEGEKQRVAVGRAIIRDPSCFLFDEPLSRLDVQLRETMRGQIKEVLTGLSKATVIVTHDQLEALTMADRIAVMQAGRIEQFDTPHKVFAEPSNVFVAGFIGTPQMNLLDAEAEPANGRIGFRIGNQRIELAMPALAPKVAAGGGYTVGIRPRGLELTGESGPDTISAVVDLIEPMGAETLLHLSVDDHDLRVVVDRHQQRAIGEQVHARWRADRVHVFGGDGLRLVS